MLVGQTGLADISRARISQVMNLLHLAPDIQESILGLPPTEGGGRAPTGSAHLCRARLAEAAGGVGWPGWLPGQRDV
jgi:hypothetical protein